MMSELLEKYADQMQSIASYVISNNLEWTPETTDEIIKGWITQQIDFYNNVDRDKLSEKLKSEL